MYLSSKQHFRISMKCVYVLSHISHLTKIILWWWSDKKRLCLISESWKYLQSLAPGNHISFYGFYYRKISLCCHGNNQVEDYGINLYIHMICSVAISLWKSLHYYFICILNWEVMTSASLQCSPVVEVLGWYMVNLRSIPVYELLLLFPVNFSYANIQLVIKLCWIIFEAHISININVLCVLLNKI